MERLQERKGITGRAILLGMVLGVMEVWWLTEIEYVRYSDSPTIPALYFHAIATLFLLLGLNALLRRWCPQRALSRGELLLVYMMVVLATNLAGHDNLQILFTTLVWVFGHATPENRWAEWIHPYLPRWAVVSDPTVLKSLFAGNDTLYRPEYLRAWAGPVLVWSAFALLWAFGMLCLASLFRRAWEAERLTFPIAEIPLALTDPLRPPLRSSPLWVGFGLAAGLTLLNLAHSLFPAVPGVNVGVRYFRASQLPWSAAGPIPVSFFPFAIGLTFLLPTQLGFSCWFFFLLSRAEAVAAAMLGWFQWGGFPYINEQSAGSYIGLCLFSLWAARWHLRRVWRAARGRGPSEPDEPLPYPFAFWGLLLSVLLLGRFLVALGMTPRTVTLYLLLFLPIVVAVTRLRAELGLPTIELYQRGADDMLRQALGTMAFSKGDLIGMTLLFWLNRTHRQFVSQNIADAFRIAHRSGLPLRGVAWVLLLAAALGIGSAFWSLLHSLYSVGLDSARFTGPARWAFGDEPWRKLTQWLTVPRDPQPGAVRAYFVGCGVTLLLVWLRTRWVWWPFHPAGYLVSGSFALMRLWVPLFISWAIKTLLLRYGGLRAYRRALPFFLGLILGEFSVGFLRTLLDLLLGLYLPATSGIGGL